MTGALKPDMAGAVECIAGDLRKLATSISAGEPITKALDVVLLLRAGAALLDAAAKRPCRCDCDACKGHKP